MDMDTPNHIGPDSMLRCILVNIIANLPICSVLVSISNQEATCKSQTKGFQSCFANTNGLATLVFYF